MELKKPHFDSHRYTLLVLWLECLQHQHKSTLYFCSLIHYLVLKLHVLSFTVFSKAFLPLTYWGQVQSGGGKWDKKKHEPLFGTIVLALHPHTVVTKGATNVHQLYISLWGRDFRELNSLNVAAAQSVLPPAHYAKSQFVVCKSLWSRPSIFKFTVSIAPEMCEITSHTVPRSVNTALSSTHMIENQTPLW